MLVAFFSYHAPSHCTLSLHATSSLTSSPNNTTCMSQLKNQTLFQIMIMIRLLEAFAVVLYVGIDLPCSMTTSTNLRSVAKIETSKKSSSERRSMLHCYSPGGRTSLGRSISIFCCNACFAPGLSRGQLMLALSTLRIHSRESCRSIKTGHRLL